MAWYDSAPEPLSNALERLDEALRIRGLSLQELNLKHAKKGYQAYGVATSVGRIWVARYRGEWGVFFSPAGAQRFINLWDWEECTLGKPRPTGDELSAVESAEWVLGLVEKGELPDVDLECIERMGLAADRRRARYRWLMPLLFLGGYVIAIGLIVSSIFSGRVWTSFTAGVLLVNLLIANLKPFCLRLRKRFKRE